MARADREACGTRFVAPCLRNGIVRIRIEGIVKNLRPSPANFCGWGTFEYSGGKYAIMTGEPMEYERDDYLLPLPKARVRLCFAGDDGAWIAYPTNAGTMKQHFGTCEPLVVRLVDGCTTFQSVIARTDGVSWWYERPDEADDMTIVEDLRMALVARTRVDSIRIKNLTPEGRKAYDMAVNPFPVAGVVKPLTDEDKIREALRQGGGELRSFVDRGDRWVVEWMTGTGERHSSAIDKEDMTVISAGICLSGQDKKFDLHTLVGVVEKRNDNDDW